MLYLFWKRCENMISSFNITIIFVALIPSLLFTILLLFLDRKRREPAKYIVLCLMSFVITVPTSVVLSSILEIFNILEIEQFSIFVAGIVEELAKLLCLVLFTRKNRHFDDPYDGMIYAALLSLSFAGFENILYIFAQSNFDKMQAIALLRGVTAVPLHLVCGIIMGYYYGVYKFTKSNQKLKKYKSLAYILPVIMHTVYNLFFSNFQIIPDTWNIYLVILGFMLIIYGIGIYLAKRLANITHLFYKNNGK